MTYYMHTLDGRPAAFFPHDGVCFTNKRITLAKSLRQIRREQTLCRAMRLTDHGYKYGYATVIL